MKTHPFLALLATILIGSASTPLMAGNDDRVDDASMPGCSIFGDLFKDTPKRHLVLNLRWGFNNWGDSPFGSFSGTTGDAEASYYFMNLSLSLDYPLINASHFGLYAGLGVDGDIYHFTSSIVNSSATGFVASTTPLANTTAAMDPNNWDSYFNNFAITLPITISIEPWKYKDFCIRLSAIPGVNVESFLHQVYDSKMVDLDVKDRECNSHVNNFMLDARLSLIYRSFGIYAQIATQPLFKSDSGYQELYPVKFGLCWSIYGR